MRIIKNDEATRIQNHILEIKYLIEEKQLDKSVIIQDFVEIILGELIKDNNEDS